MLRLENIHTSEIYITYSHTRLNELMVSYWQPLSHISSVEPAVSVQSFSCPLLVSQISPEDTVTPDTDLTHVHMLHSKCVQIQNSKQVFNSLGKL